MKGLQSTIVMLLIACIPGISLAQYFKPDTKLTYRVRIKTDSGTMRGFYVADTDSIIIISPVDRYNETSLKNIPVSSISKMNIKDGSFGARIAVVPVVFSLGFILTAGLTKNAGDVDNDGKTSFWELLFTAIEGSTSSNRRRRKTALIVGGSGGLLFTVLYFATNHVSLKFPIGSRHNYYLEKRHKIHDYTHLF